MRLAIIFGASAAFLVAGIGCGDSGSDGNNTGAGGFSAGGFGGAGVGGAGVGGAGVGGAGVGGAGGFGGGAGGAPAGGAGGMGFGGAGGAGGGGMCMFGIAGASNPACDPCARTNCCSELSVCLQDATCMGLNTCLNGQPAMGTCLDTAMTQQAFESCLQMLCPNEAGAIQQFIAVQACLGTRCMAECT